MNATRLANPPTGILRSEKIAPRHYDRLAVVYVRRSTAQQVLDHQESTRLQYGLVTRAQELGWAEARVVVIDDDLGQSGARVEARVGFQRLVSEVSLDHVGLVLGVDMSRLARSSKEWHQLLEICALFGTLIADVDGVYDPGQYNDRLLLGLKGTMSEAELHTLKQRMEQGRLSKARRGELAVAVPGGYVRRPSGEAALDPDEQVQQVVRLVFRTFAELGTRNAVLRSLVKHRIQRGIRVREGPGKGDLEWRRPNRMTLQNLLQDPMYAGAYAYGRRQIDPRRQQPGRPRTGRRVIDPDGWYVPLRDRCPAYISWAQYEGNLARLKANQARAEEVGVARKGAALLAGLVVCATCGRRLHVRYGGRGRRHTDGCSRLMSNYGGETCQQLAGPPLDDLLCQWVLAALTPAALELSLEAATHVERERADLVRLREQRLERAAYEAERAGRQYRRCEPENRLVARQLERDWEAALAAQRQLQFERQRPQVLSAVEREHIRRLAHDIPALWAAATTTTAERKELVRQVVERVVVVADGSSERVRVCVTWAGGAQTTGALIRPVARLGQRSYYPQLCARLRTLADDGLTAAAIAARRNVEGYRPPKRRDSFGRRGGQASLQRLGVRAGRPQVPPQDEVEPDEWWLAALAQTVGMPASTLQQWARRGWVRARQQGQPPRRWIVWADEAAVEQLRRRHQRPTGYYTRRRWVGQASMPPAPGTTAKQCVAEREGRGVHYAAQP